MKWQGDHLILIMTLDSVVVPLNQLFCSIPVFYYELNNSEKQSVSLTVDVHVSVLCI